MFPICILFTLYFLQHPQSNFSAFSFSNNTSLITTTIAPGTVKNRLKFIFSVLEVGDKQGFINEYSTFEICYGEYTSEQISSMTFTDDDFIE